MASGINDSVRPFNRVGPIEEYVLKSILLLKSSMLVAYGKEKKV